MAAPAKSSPRDAQVMAAVLKDMGVLDYEPRLINQMLEFTYRYITDILDDAKVYSTHANKKNLDTDDVKLAIQCKMDHSFTTPPPRDLLMEIARHKNSQQLPLIKPYSLPRLPPDRYCLSAPNYRLRTLKKSRIQIGLPQFSSGSPRISIAPMQSKGSSSSSHSLTVVSKAQPTVTIISKPAAATIPKPTIRVNTGMTKVLPNTSGQIITTRPIPTSTLSTIGQQGALGGQPVIPGVNPLKRKLEDDDYDK
ncbi:transcription initiation factor TFIID subunit 9B-like [Haliotis asinina]|uniref:transcription initiation factor TFIID subunit 9B-like n=1 Tax=Haliotis asinina TaxID=109174 RepID=UPI0035319DB1